MKDHFRPVGKPAPPRPRSPDSLICSTIHSRPLRISSLVPSQSPRRRAPSSRQSLWPYRLVKMRSLSASISFLSFKQSSAAAYGLGPTPPGYRTPRRWMPVTQCVEQCLRCWPIEILVEIVVDLKDWRVDAGSQTFDLDQREKSVRRGAANADTELALTGADHLVRTAQPTGRGRASLQQISSDRPQIEHRVKSCDLVDPDRRHPEHFCDAVHCRPREPSAMLALRQIQQRQHRASLASWWIFGDVRLRPFEVLSSEFEARGLLEFDIVQRRAHRSISPKTMSMEPMIATTSASMWPRVIKSVAWRKAKPGDLILQRYG